MMTDLEKTLRHSLSADDKTFLQDLEDGRGLFTQLGATFQGPMRFWSVVVWIFVLAASALGFYCIWKMIGAPDTRSLILWTAGAWAAWTVQINLKQWIFQRMATLTLLRELKKIELRLAGVEKEAR